MSKIAFIGAGNLGSCIAFEAAANGLADQLALIDVNEKLAAGQAADMLQGVCLEHDVEVRAGDYRELEGADVAVISAGRPRGPETKTRLELAQANYPIIRNVAEKLKGFEGTVITLTNPLDISNYFIQKLSGVERERVIGSGSLLDTARFRLFLSSMFRCPPSEVSAQVIGEHGDRQVPLFSKAKVLGRLQSFDTSEREKITSSLLGEALTVIAGKGGTVYAPARCTYYMIESILKSPGDCVCSVVLEGEYGQSGVSIGVPVELGVNGVKKIKEWGLDSWEKERFDRGAEMLRREIIKL